MQYPEFTTSDNFPPTGDDPLKTARPDHLGSTIAAVHPGLIVFSSRFSILSEWLVAPAVEIPPD
ncbi:hypothetical protein [Roseobacter litoralis]|uniref:hypothetical protein n=1 Tax=Roseobacter litoralis TaxID=42443 RepID=UPI00249342AF|nr:hypothetical protein [Roseobacter litoralis]